VFPRRWRESSISPALRSYHPGEGFDYLAIIYNAKSKGGLEPQLESQFVLYKNEEEYIKGNIDIASFRGVDDLEGIPIAQRLTFGKKMDEGDYVLQLLVTDKQAKKKFRSAVQAIDFRICEESEPGCETSSLR
jgi:hypothetical protein